MMITIQITLKFHIHNISGYFREKKTLLPRLEFILNISVVESGLWMGESAHLGVYFVLFPLGQSFVVAQTACAALLLLILLLADCRHASPCSASFLLI